MNILEQLINRKMAVIEREQTKITDRIFDAERLGEKKAANMWLNRAHTKGFQWKAMSDLVDRTGLKIEDLRSLS